jgi:hypothetical protein
MVKLILALILLAHGIGHSMGLLQAFKVATVNPQWQGDSWILTGIAGQTLTTAIGVVIWSAAILAFTALAGVMVGWLPATWWQPLAIAGAAISLAGLFLFPVAFPTLSTIGALAIDVILLVAVVWQRWSPETAL